MKKSNKIEHLDDFDKLDKKRKKAVVMQFEGAYTDEEIAKNVGRTRSTITLWKKEQWFKKAFNAYANKLIKNKYRSKAMNTVFELLNAKSEMVRLQAASTIFKLSGMLSDNSTPELDRAKIRKANADARVAEAKAKAMEDNGQDMEQLLDKMLDTVTREDKKDGNK
ncbi:phBC6A51 family helix-turn-helix protein [Lactobacillus crispatus]|uniref:phBC6A51 family helix-turn-helix protein n=1 Tax=Lactobacillus crispatus TaxID=47770 RepID=UPI0021A7D937|nr:phBC6A51 family helix-turn-helix protein [Lactobacillus crispatus]